MIYHITFSCLQQTYTINHWHFPRHPITPEQQKLIGKTIKWEERLKVLAEFIKSSEDDTFIFILTKNQYQQWEKFPEFLKQYDLEKLIVAESKGITNPVHSNVKHNLKVVILQSEKHFQREERKEKVEE